MFFQILLLTLYNFPSANITYSVLSITLIIIFFLYVKENAFQRVHLFTVVLINYTGCVVSKTCVRNIEYVYSVSTSYGYKVFCVTLSCLVNHFCDVLSTDFRTVFDYCVYNVVLKVRIVLDVRRASYSATLTKRNLRYICLFKKDCVL